MYPKSFEAGKDDTSIVLLPGVEGRLFDSPSLIFRFTGSKLSIFDVARRRD